MCQLTAAKLTQLMHYQRWLHSCATLWSLPCSCCSWTNPVSHLLPLCLCCPLWVRQPVPLRDVRGSTSRLRGLWSLYCGGAHAECNHVASQERELIWLKTTHACWLSFQLLQVPDLVHQSLVPTHRREEGGVWKWVATEIHVKGALAVPLAMKPCPAVAVVHSRVEGSKEELALTHSFIAVDRQALGEVWGGTEMLKAKQLRKDAVWY